MGAKGSVETWSGADFDTSRQVWLDFSALSAQIGNKDPETCPLDLMLKALAAKLDEYEKLHPDEF